ncbi:unnamed protein product [Protopolystoma xenopodis]|uniref:Uncharacterized protein n=1 Tax=Protopolystoma xenopodis TaxID=117903 RepID=A0A448X4S3_9PLAT|nr:unnamed protein product [Protopolystoma xenopodis]
MVLRFCLDLVSVFIGAFHVRIALLAAKLNLPYYVTSCQPSDFLNDGAWLLLVEDVNVASPHLNHLLTASNDYILAFTAISDTHTG